jgi:hypothetical protein
MGFYKKIFLEGFSDLFLENVFENLEGFLIIHLIGYLIGYINHDVVLYNYIFYGVFYLRGWGFSFE